MSGEEDVTEAEIFVFDTSALAKRFVQEPGSDRVVAICRRARPEALWISQLAILEMKSLLRLARDKARISGEQADRVQILFRREIRRRFQVWEFLPQDWKRAEGFIDRHALRPADSLQLSAAASIREIRKPERVMFVCSDQELVRAAAAEGLSALDPVSG